MTRQEAEKLIEALVTLRESATDEQALTAIDIYPKWQEGNSYIIGSRVVYDGVLYRVLQEHTSQADWTPDVAVSLFTKVLIPDDTQIYDWEQPESTNPYKLGDKVRYEGQVWISTVDNNIWQPGVYGWEVYSE